jgi:hypothetical protein
MTCIHKPDARANLRRRLRHDLEVARKVVPLLADRLDLEYQQLLLTQQF